MVSTGFVMDKSDHGAFRILFYPSHMLSGIRAADVFIIAFQDFSVNTGRNCLQNKQSTNSIRNESYLYRIFTCLGVILCKFDAEMSEKWYNIKKFVGG